MKWHISVAVFALSFLLSGAVLVALEPPPALQAPTIAFTAPPDGSTVAGSVDLAVTASPTTACVQYQVDGQVIGTSKAGPFSWTWASTAVADGAHILKAIAEDAAGVDSLPATRSVTVANGTPPPPPPPPPVDTELPKVTLVSPSSGAVFVAGTFQTVSATANDNVGVTALQFTVDGQPLGGVLPAPPYQAIWMATIGSHTITATAHDAANNSASASVPVTVNAAPVVPTMTVSAITSGNSGNYTLTARLSQPLSGLAVTMVVTGPTGTTRTINATMTSGVATGQVKLKGQPLGIYTVQAVTLVNGTTVTGTMTFRL